MISRVAVRTRSTTDAGTAWKAAPSWKAVRLTPSTNCRSSSSARGNSGRSIADVRSRAKEVTTPIATVRLRPTSSKWKESG